MIHIFQAKRSIFQLWFMVLSFLPAACFFRIGHTWLAVKVFPLGVR